MPRQLIYTSAPRGLVPGQSGYCTVARSRDLREALIPRLEKLSYYSHDDDPNAVICGYRILEVRGARYHVLTRIVAAGLDFTKRRKFLAHHLVFEPEELRQTQLSPAGIFLGADHWKNSWDGPPDWLEDPSVDHAKIAPPAPRVGTGGFELLPQDGAWIRADSKFRDGVSELLVLDEELHPAENRWRITFTTHFQPADDPSDFMIRIVVPGTAGEQEALKLNAAFITFESLKSDAPASENIAIHTSKAASSVKAASPAAVGQKRRFHLFTTVIFALCGLTLAVFWHSERRSSLPASTPPPQASAPAQPQRKPDFLPLIFPEKPTWLLAVRADGSGGPVEIPAWQTVFKQLRDAEIFSKDLQAAMQTNLRAAAVGANLDARVHEGSLRCATTNGPSVELFFNGIIRAPTNAPIAVELAGARLLMAPANSPIPLPKRLLDMDAAHESVTLRPELENCLRPISLPKGGELALRPTVDPFAAIQKEFSIQPATTLDLLALRADVEKILADKETKIAAMKAEHASLVAAAQKVLTKQGPEETRRKKRFEALNLALPKAVEELSALQEKAATLPTTLRGVGAYSLFLCQSNVNREVFRFIEEVGP